MLTTEELLFVTQLLVALLIVYDANAYRQWMDQKRFLLVLFVVVMIPLVGALYYIYWVAREEGERIECPDCGEPLHHADEACPHCETEREEVHLEGHACDACDATFDTEIGLLRHRTRKHPDAEGTGVICPDCGEPFDSERGLHIHQGLKHGDDADRTGD